MDIFMETYLKIRASLSGRFDVHKMWPPDISSSEIHLFTIYAIRIYVYARVSARACVQVLLSAVRLIVSCSIVPPCRPNWRKMCSKDEVRSRGYYRVVKHIAARKDQLHLLYKRQTGEPVLVLLAPVLLSSPLPTPSPYFVLLSLNKWFIPFSRRAGPLSPLTNPRTINARGK